MLPILKINIYHDYKYNEERANYWKLLAYMFRAFKSSNWRSSESNFADCGKQILSVIEENGLKQSKHFFPIRISEPIHVLIF